MNFEEVHTYAEELYKKPKKLDFYHDWIGAWIEEYPHLSAAQLRDTLMDADLNIRESTVQLYVEELLEIYQIERKYIPVNIRCSRTTNGYKNCFFPS